MSTSEPCCPFSTFRPWCFKHLRLLFSRSSTVAIAGDGFFATFDGPARAIRCARRVVEAVETLGLRVRAGLHTGEVELNDGGVTGLAVHIGARVGYYTVILAELGDAPIPSR